MLSTVRIQSLPLKRVARLRFDSPCVSATHAARLFHEVPTSCSYSTSTSNSEETPLSAFPPLPEQSEWRPIFNHSGAPIALRERVSIRNPQTARTLAERFTRWTKPLLKADEAMGKGRTTKTAPRIIIEAFPGPGALTRALLTLPRDSFDKLIVLEEQPLYLEYLKPLEKVDDRVKVFPYSGYNWDTYTLLDQQGWLEDVPTVPWEDGVHPSLQFISHVPLSITGEQLVNQFLRCIPDKTWLFKYGRVPLNLIMGQWLWQRSSAGPEEMVRCKLSVIAEAAAGLSLSLPAKTLAPYEEHWHPTVGRLGKPSKQPDGRKVGHPMVGVDVLPHAEQVIEEGMLEKWDYCLRKLFVLKGRDVKSAIGSLAPGAQSLLKALTDPTLPPEQRLDVKKQIKKLDIKDWALIIRAFDNWPFAPADLLIHDTYNPGTRDNFPT